MSGRKMRSTQEVCYICTHREVCSVACEQFFRGHLILAVGHIHTSHNISLYIT